MTTKIFSSRRIEQFRHIKTPFYYYDMELLEENLKTLTTLARQYGYHIHYALKANANIPLLGLIRRYGLGADCVSGSEIDRALHAGFAPKSIVFAGVGKRDDEIIFALQNDIFAFNCESLQELEVINQLAGQLGKTARVALRLNPDVDPHTHEYITTGKEENKFGIPHTQIDEALAIVKRSAHLELIGLHFHIGSQITDMAVFRQLALQVNAIQKTIADKGFTLPHLNLGGGLGIDYEDPDAHPIPDYSHYFDTIASHLEPLPGQQVHFELGRAVVGQCGTLITRVLYVKEGLKKRFAVVDAGMTDLIRPALYRAYHKIQNLTGSGEEKRYDVVGPVCESSDFLGKDVPLPEVRRGDILAVRSAGAYGQVMASHYNLRDFPGEVYSNMLE